MKTLCLTIVAALLLTRALSAAEYVNDDSTCADCHPTQYQKHSQSIHLQMIRSATGADLANVHANLKAPKAPSTNEFTHVIGGWYKEESYLKVEAVGGTNKYSVTKYEWNPIKGTFADDKVVRDWLVKCASCHTTGYDVNTRTFQQFNIHCESCHGPAAEHVRSPETVRPIKDTSSEGCGHCHIRAESAATAQFPAKTFNFPIGYELGNPASLTFIPEAITNLASFFPDGTANRHREQYLDVHYPGVRKTKHYEAGVSCTKCHDPHSSGTVTVHQTAALPAGKHGVKIYNNVTGTTAYSEWNGEGLLKSREELCSSCHSTIRNDHVHAFTTAAQAAAQNGQVSCVDCHMPDVINIDATTLRGALHTHTFQNMRPETSVSFGPDIQPNSCTYRCHQDKGANKSERALWAAAYTSVTLTQSREGNVMRLTGKGLRDFEYRIEASTDLDTWTPVATQKAVNGTFQFQGETVGGYLFYRALELGQPR